MHKKKHKHLGAVVGSRAQNYSTQFACKSKSVTAGLWAGGAGVPRVSRGRLGVASSPRVR